MESSATEASAAAALAKEGEGGEYRRLEFGFARLPGWRGEGLILLGLLAAACLLTWPMVVTLDQATGIRGDYFNNLWNAWWVKHSILGGHSPFWTDYLYFPDGISLQRHTLSLLNSLTLAGLGELVGPHRAFSLLVLAHFALSAWCFSLLGRYVTGSTAGGLLGGLLYSFCPFHYFYICQINVFSFEFLPLALLFFLKHAREGGGRNLTALLLSLAGMVLSVEYYVVYAYMAVAILFACARGWGGSTPVRTLFRRLVTSGALGALLVALLAFPLLSAAFTSAGHEEALTSANSIEKTRFNDLYGFFWIGGDEECTVSWPTMLGYSTLLFLLLGWRQVRRHWPWLVMGLVFLVLSLGEELAIGRQKTGIPLPYALIQKAPVLSMLRKSDRCFMMVQLAVALALCAAWPALAAHLRSMRLRGAAWTACAGLLMVELTGVPFNRFTIPTSPHFAALRADPSVTSVLELPPAPIHIMNGRFDYYQTLHEKKTTLGYTTSIALTPLHDQRLQSLVNLYLLFLKDQNRALLRLGADLGVDRVVHYKTSIEPRPNDPTIDGITIWKPFVLARRPLLYVRQVGEYVETSFKPATWDYIRLMFTRVLGAPLFEDDYLVIFNAPR